MILDADQIENLYFVLTGSGYATEKNIRKLCDMAKAYSTCGAESRMQESEEEMTQAEKLQAAIKWLDTRWVLHPQNRVPKLDEALPDVFKWAPKVLDVFKWAPKVLKVRRVKK